MSNTTEKVIDLLRIQGSRNSYGEDCSVLSHSVQSGLIAKDQGLDEELILSALLHDIGHLSPMEKQEASYEEMGEYGIEAHDLWGESYLKNLGFSQRIIAPVKNHVAAKRYLCFKIPTYYEDLSEASKMTLSFQGGPMTEEEAKQFEQTPFFEESISIRKIDDLAKAERFEILTEHWDFFRLLLDKALNKAG